MQAIHAENVAWKEIESGSKEAELYSQTQSKGQDRIDMVEVPAGCYLPPQEGNCLEFITILLSAGAQMQIGDRIFRPTAGQLFRREPGDLFALTNDSHHPFRYTVVRLGWTESKPITAKTLEAAPEKSAEDIEATVEIAAIEESAPIENEPSPPNKSSKKNKKK